MHELVLKNYTIKKIQNLCKKHFTILMKLSK